MLVLGMVRKSFNKRLTYFIRFGFSSKIDDYVPLQNRDLMPVIRSTEPIPIHIKEQSDNYKEIVELKIRVQEKNISLAEHLEYLRKPSILNNFKSIIIVLNSLFKKLV